MKNIFKVGVLSVAMLSAVGCGDFGDINIDPNNTTSVAPETLLTSSLRSVASVVGRTDEMFYTQMWSQTQYTDGSRYVTVNYDFNGWYTGPLADLNHIIEINSNEDTKADALVSGSNENQIAVARIMKAFFFHFMTDRWGPLPYSQALQGRTNLKPAYDDQETIYLDLIKELKEAVAMMGGAGVKGDFILGGDMAHWAKFANSIRATIAMRMSNVNPSLAQTEFVDAVGDGVITTADENVMYPYQADANNQNPWFAAFITRTDYAISETLVDYMKPLNDPRLNMYADPAPLYGDVRGMPYGIENAGDIPNDEISFPGFPAVRGQDAPIAVFTGAQMHFLLAEAALKGWVSGDAQAYYEGGIAESMKQWGVYDDAAFADFIAQDGVAWDAAKGMELIGYQKWVALYLQGAESWSEWRRTGYPVLSPAPDPLNADGQIPRRHGYPTSERDINSDNYAAAVQMLGGPDELSTRLWWDN
jgi:hypothetical protein